MGVREEILTAARALTLAGNSPFAPVAVINKARSFGCTYPDTTIRTFIVGPMCINSPNNHATQYGDLRRVGRGLYRLTETGEAAADKLTVQSPANPDPAAPKVLETQQGPHHRDWSWEGNVQARLVQHLTADGWNIIRVADTESRERGIDVRARRGSITMFAEVKGFPSSDYLRGPQQGTPKPTNVNVQARHYFADALLTVLLMRADHQDARILMVLPEFATYRNLSTRTASTLDCVGIEIWFVAADGAVTERQ